MTAVLQIITTPSFDRLARKLAAAHPATFPLQYAEVRRILGSDPYNRSRQHQIKKLTNVEPEEGQYRLRLGRWRFRYSIYHQTVVLYYCGLRRENTY